MYTYAINRDYISQRLLLTNHVMIVINAGEGGGGGERVTVEVMYLTALAGRMKPCIESGHVTG